MNRRWIGLAACVGLVWLGGCLDTPPDDNGMDDGPVTAGVSGKLGDAIPSATADQSATFERGKAVLSRRFDLHDGLGPTFNLTSCGGCHEKPQPGGSSGLYRSFFLAGRVTDDGAFVFSESAGMAGGVIRVFNYGSQNPFRPIIPETTNVFAQRNAIPMFGMGLIAELSEEELLSRSDPDDADGDGISGRPNFDRGFVGRFGRKSQTVSLEGFIRGPLFNHLGITTTPLSDEQRSQLPVDSSAQERLKAAEHAPQETSKLGPHMQAAAPDSPNFDDDRAADPELSADDLFDLVSFSMLLAAPAIETPTEQSNRGRLLFHEADCSACHAPRLEGPRGPLPVYSDLLLHDMGPELADGIRQGVATGSEFRTQPLWGVSAEGPYLHDGRADTLEEAILVHGGEAQAARDAFAAYTDQQKKDVLEFLLSLGGRDQASSGLLEPEALVPPAGSYGGPLRELTSSEMERFIAGREVFDHEFGQSKGVGALTSNDPGAGARFNGDSCRACHFQPVIGGSGPRDVNVMRHGHVDAEGQFTAPSNTPNTILHKQIRTGFAAAQPESGINVFEHRQTPSLFGMGLIDAISEETILSHADAEDSDGDGISGRAHQLSDGRVGRFGWKAQVPSGAEFVRDAMAAEIGLTLPDQAGLTFGITEDNDGVPDPELTLSEAQDVALFMSLLGPPPRQTAQYPESAAAGEIIFATVGCTKCHIPSLESSLGEVPLFSDLLLHEILPAGSAGIVDGEAEQREFRTAPLWGLSQTAPYFHSGQADTIDESIRLHDGEAAEIRQVYENLSDESRSDLLAFLETL